jgi:hypothetical protein
MFLLVHYGKNSNWNVLVNSYEEALSRAAIRAKTVESFTFAVDPSEDSTHQLGVFFQAFNDATSDSFGRKLLY